jgi:methionyl-tRNA formyltransferase
MKAKIIFFGSDQYSQIVLEALKKSSDLEIIKVVKEKKELPNLKNNLSQPDIGIVASFGALIPPDILSWPKKGLLNLHPSLLPKYRGPTPVPTAILNGEKETGLTIIKVDEQIDHGPIVAQFKEIIQPEDTSESLLKRLFTFGGETLITILPSYLEGKIEFREQNHNQATFTRKLTREDGKIDWSKPAHYQERFIRAMFPWPGAWGEVRIDNQVKRLKILKAHLKEKKLILDLVQLEGKKPVTWKQFLEGYPQAKLPF